MADRSEVTDLPLVAGVTFRLGPAADAQQWRAIRPTPDGESWYCFPLDSEPGKSVPKCIPIAVLARQRQLGQLAPLNPDEDTWRAVGCDLSERAEVLFKKNWDVVRTILDDELAFLDRSTRPAYLLRLKKKHKWSPSTLRAKMDRFYRGGANAWAMAPAFERRGGKGVTRGSPKTARYRLTPDDEAFIAERSKKRQSTQRNRDTASSIAVELNKSHGEVLRETPEGIPAESTTTGKVSVRQVAYRLDKDGNSATAQLQQKSPEQIQGLYRSRVGSAAARATAPGEVYEIDAWHNSEQHLLHPLCHKLEMPCLRLWSATDVFTGHLVSVYPDFRSESQESFLAALYHLLAGEPNPRWEQLLPTIRRRRQGLPRTLRLDGIARPYASDKVVQYLGLQIDTVAPASGDKKPFAESFNEWTRTHVVKGRSGALLAEEAARGLKRLSPTYCLTDFMLDLHCGLATFDATPITKKQYPPGLRAFLTDHPTRESLWDAGERYSGRVLRSFSIDLMRRVLLTRTKVRVTTDGIMVRKRAFTCARAEAEKWFYRGVRGVPRYVTVIEDPLCVSRVWLDVGAGEPLEPCWLLPASADYALLQLVEAEMWETEESERIAKAKDKQMDAQVLYAFQRSAIAKRARARVRAQKKASAAKAAPTAQVEGPEISEDGLNDEERAILACMSEPA